MSAKKLIREDQVPTRGRSSDQALHQHQLLKKAFYAFAEEVTHQFERLEQRTNRTEPDRGRFQDLEARIAALQLVRSQPNPAHEAARLAANWAQDSLHVVSMELNGLKERIDKIQGRTLQHYSKQIFSVKSQFNDIIETNARSLKQTLQPLFQQVAVSSSRIKQLQAASARLAGLIPQVKQQLRSAEGQIRETKTRLSQLGQAVESVQARFQRVQSSSSNAIKEQWQNVRDDCQSLRQQIQLLRGQSGSSRQREGQRRRLQTIEEQLRAQQDSRRKLAEQLQSIQEYFEFYKEENYKLGSKADSSLQKIREQSRQQADLLAQHCAQLAQFCKQAVKSLANDMRAADARHKEQLEKVVNYMFEAEKQTAVATQASRSEMRKLAVEVAERVQRQDSLLQLYRQAIERGQAERRTQIQKVYAQVGGHLVRRRGLSP